MADKKRWVDVAEDMQRFVIQKLKTEAAHLKEDRVRAMETLKWPEAVKAAEDKLEAIEVAISELYFVRTHLLSGDEAPATTAIVSAPTMPSPASEIVAAASIARDLLKSGNMPASIPAALVVAAASALEGRGAVPARVVESTVVAASPFKHGDTVRHKITCTQGTVTRLEGDFVWLRGKGPYRLSEVEKVT